jgi:glycosyltransferase involved in cell wall biosynthesis
MRILHLDTGREMRGGQWQVLRLIEGLAAAGVESTLLARAGAPLYEAVHKGGWRVEPVGLTRAVRLAGSHDLMHAHDAHGHTLGAIVRNSRLVVSRRVAFPVGSRWKYGRARRYLAVSEFVKGVMLKGGVAADKIEVVYDGVPLLEPAHGEIVLAHEKESSLAHEAGRLAGIDVKRSTDLERDLRNAAMFVYVTYAEGLGSAALLAMAAGVPVIASNVGGLPEAIRDGENGLLVENSAEAIAAAMKTLRDDPAYARRLGHEARRTIAARFTVDHMVRRTMEVYRQVLA